VLFLLTSTNEPYIHDVLDLLFLPSGIDYRFRYHRQWIPDEFQSDEKLKSLHGVEGFAIHIDTKKYEERLSSEEPDVYEIREFIPIRKVCIREAEFFGEFLWVSFTLGDWVYYREEAKRGVPNEHHETFRRATPQVSQGKVTKIFYEVEHFKVETIPDDFSGKSARTNSNWFRIVSHISKLEAHAVKQTIFMKLWRIAEGGTTCIEPAELPGGFTGYFLDSNKHYFVDVLQFLPYGSPKTPIGFSVQTDSRIVRELKPQDTVQGKYDLLRMILQCKQVSRDENSFMRFLPTDQHQHMMASNLIHIRVRHSLTALILSCAVRSILTFLGVLLAGMSSQLSSGQPLNTSVLTLSAVGAVLVMFASLWSGLSQQ